MYKYGHNKLVIFRMELCGLLRGVLLYTRSYRLGFLVWSTPGATYPIFNSCLFPEVNLLTHTHTTVLFKLLAYFYFFIYIYKTNLINK